MEISTSEGERAVDDGDSLGRRCREGADDERRQAERDRLHLAKSKYVSEMGRENNKRKERSDRDTDEPTSAAVSREIRGCLPSRTQDKRLIIASASHPRGSDCGRRPVGVSGLTERPTFGANSGEFDFFDSKNAHLLVAIIRLLPHANPVELHELLSGVDVQRDCPS